MPKASHSPSGDQQGCTRHDDGSVTTPEGFKEAYKAYTEASWGTLSAPAEFGGQDMPHVLAMAFEALLKLGAMLALGASTGGPGALMKVLQTWPAPAPLLPSDLVLDCFEHARATRVLDMEASPYDVRDLGYGVARGAEMLSVMMALGIVASAFTEGDGH